jgi:hypothetical protein
MMTDAPAPAVEPIREEPIAEIPVAPLMEEAPSVGALTGTVADVMTKDEFFDFFSHSFTVAGGIVGAMQPPPLQTLMGAGELPTARPAADALYDMAAKFSWLQFLIRKDGEWIASVVALGAFGIQLSTGIMGELAARKPAPESEEVPQLGGEWAAS